MSFTLRKGLVMLQGTESSRSKSYTTEAYDSDKYGGNQDSYISFGDNSKILNGDNHCVAGFYTIDSGDTWQWKVVYAADAPTGNVCTFDFLRIPGNQIVYYGNMMNYVNFISGVEIPDALYNALCAFAGDFSPSITDNKNYLLMVFRSEDMLGAANVENYTITNTYEDGVKETFYIDSDTGTGVFYNRFSRNGNVTVDVVLDALQLKKTFSYNVTGAPEQPSIELVYQNGSAYLKVTTNSVGNRGNIYFNGGASPLTTYQMANNSNEAFVPIENIGAYTANCIVNIAEQDVYGRLSETLVVETQTIEESLSFNEYTGILKSNVQEDSVHLFTLEKNNGTSWDSVSSNETGEFAITESGEYRITLTPNPFWVAPSSYSTVEVSTTLDAPNAYVEFDSPSQLGFDEIDGATSYEIYRLDDDGNPVLYDTIYTSIPKVRIKRQLKKFIMVVKDEYHII